jgi:hypothetical protein
VLAPVGDVPEPQVRDAEPEMRLVVIRVALDLLGKERAPPLPASRATSAAASS